MKNNHKALFVENGIIYVSDGNIKTPLVNIKDIPITFEGSLECNIENSLAAAASLYAFGTPIETIKKGLLTFKPDIKMNPGRFNIFEISNFKVMLDYGHNISGYEEVGKFVQNQNTSRLIGIIGVPGDRSNESIIKIGKLCSKIFDKIYVKEDVDLRGRKPNEVASLLYNAITNNNFSKSDVKIILNEIDALRVAIAEAQESDLIILFYEDLEPALELIEKAKDFHGSLSEFDDDKKTMTDINEQDEIYLDETQNESTDIPVNI
jgi:cyanophycin synthetase